MDTYLCPTTRDSTQRAAPVKVSSTFMQHNWTYHAYSMAHDGKTTIVHHVDGIEVIRGRSSIKLPLATSGNPRDYYWHPDSRRVAFWVTHTPKATRPGQLVGGRRAVAVMDVARLPTTPPRAGDPPPYEVVYVTTAEKTPFGIEWSPRGDALYLIERGIEAVDNQAFGALTRVDLNDTSNPREIVRMPGSLDFFMPPVSRFDRGEGPSSSSYVIIFGHMDGLYIIDPDGKNPQRISQLPAVGLYNIEWNPKPNKKEVILFFRRAVQAGDGRMFVGAYQIKIDELMRHRRGEAAVEAPAAPAAEGFDPTVVAIATPGIEQLYEETDLHTLWYSPKGTYMTWAAPWGLWYRKSDDSRDKTVQVQVPLQDGTLPEVKGLTWSDDERKLAFTAGNKLFICELPSNEVYEVASFNTGGNTFLAEPRFVGDQVYLTCFENAVASGRIKSGLHFGTPQAPVDPSLGRGGTGGGTPAPAPTPAPTPPRRR